MPAKRNDKRVWTGSAPCQPFSAAGAGDGFDDKRHLWPAFYWLITQLAPERIYGEQVASKAVDPWIDLVHADMEAMGYAFGGVAFPSAGVGAPHIRDRTYWMADANSGGQQQFASWPRVGEKTIGAEKSNVELGDNFDTGRLGDSDHTRPQGHAGHDGAAGRGGSPGSVAAAGVFGGVGYADSIDAGRHGGNGVRTETPSSGERMFDGHQRDGINVADGTRRMADSDGRPDGRKSNIITRANVGGLAAGDGSSYAGHDATGPTNGLWRNADWLLCRDGKWRPVEPGTFPLAHGAPARVGRLRAYGNAINLEAAYEFIMATRDY